jgi:hypothetical protein
MNIIFFRRPKPRQFNYIPRYYDPVKDEIEQRKKELGLIQEGDLQARMRADIRRKWRVERNPASKQFFIMRLFIYIVVIGFTLYFIFFSDFINNLVSFFVK